MKEKQLDPSVHSFCQCLGAGCILSARPSGRRATGRARRSSRSGFSSCRSGSSRRASFLLSPIPANFTAASPTKETVNAFLQTSWGYDETRIWEVWSIQKTAAEGVSRVTLLVNDKSGKQKPTVVEFFALPDGKHILAQNEIIPFGENPYKEFREIARQRAEGPYRGAAAKDLEIIEFADFQCPHCKDAQANMEKLAADFPKARFVFQTFPLESIHAQAARAASYGYCVTKQGGSNAFFTFASAVFDGQEGLDPPMAQP